MAILRQRVEQFYFALVIAGEDIEVTGLFGLNLDAEAFLAIEDARLLLAESRFRRADPARIDGSEGSDRHWHCLQRSIQGKVPGLCLSDGGHTQ